MIENYLSIIILSIIIAFAAGFIVGWTLSSVLKIKGVTPQAAPSKQKKEPLVSAYNRPPAKVPSVPPTSPLKRGGLGGENDLCKRSNAHLHQNLLQKALGDKAVVNRLVKYEQEQNPNANMEVWLQAAIDRWEKDHNR